MEKIFVKLKDTSGSLFIHSQGIKVIRTQTAEVENDGTVAAAVKGGALIVIKEEEHKAFWDKRNAAMKEVTKVTAAAAPKITPAPENPTEEEIRSLIGNAEAKKVLELKDEKYFYGKTNLGKFDDAVEELKDDYSLFTEVWDDTQKAK